LTLSQGSDDNQEEDSQTAAVPSDRDSTAADASSERTFAENESYFIKRVTSAVSTFTAGYPKG
jgi:hypothetical protein